MQVNHIDNINLTERGVPLGTEIGKSFQFEKLFQEKIALQGENDPTIEVSDPGNASANQRVFLGTLNKKYPTVSHLLYASSHKENCWNILDLEVNADKPFTRIPSGTPIFMDTQTSEIIWGSSLTDDSAAVFQDKNPVPGIHSMPENIAQDASIDETMKLPASGMTLKEASNIASVASKSTSKSIDGSSPGLDKAVGAFIGTSYSRMNCYELLVEGLESMGVQYRGSHGLSSHLVEQASRQGKSSYSLHSGEGLTRAIGSDVFMESIIKVNRVNSQARDVMKKMSNVLQEGQILSFSTPTKGHTGVISKKGENWTFINSGVMDHNLAGKNGGKAVGEETLNDEIKNWFRRAQKEGNGLTITLGEVDTKKLSRFQQQTSSTLSQRA